MAALCLAFVRTLRIRCEMDHCPGALVKPRVPCDHRTSTMQVGAWHASMSTIKFAEI